MRSAPIDDLFQRFRLCLSLRRLTDILGMGMVLLKHPASATFLSKDRRLLPSKDTKAARTDLSLVGAAYGDKAGKKKFERGLERIRRLGHGNLFPRLLWSRVV